MSVLDLDEVKLHLNIDRDDQDVELQATLDAAESAIAVRVGPLEPTSKTERVSGDGRSTLALSSLPVASLTTVVDQDGGDVAVADLVVSSSGVIEYESAASVFTSRRYTVTYEAGHDPLPADLRQAVLEMARHLWMTQRGGGTRPGSPPSTELSNTLPGSSTALPFRVAQLIVRHELPGFA